MDVNPSRAKRNFFEIIGSQFDRCAAPGDKHIWTRIIHRQGDDIPAIVNVDSGWHGEQVETIERTWDGGEGEQFIVETDKETCRTKCFLNWETIARTAGNELSRVLLTSHLLGSKEGKANFPHGVCGWLLAMGRLYEAGELSLPIQTGYVDQNTWLNACDANNHANDPSEQEKDLYRAQFNELWAKTLQIGKEYICEDTITASVLFAKWLSINDWPFCELGKQLESPNEQRNQQHARATKPLEQAEIWVAVPTITKLVGLDRSSLSQWVSEIPDKLKRKQGKSWEVKFPDANAHWPSTWKKIDLDDC